MTDIDMDRLYGSHEWGYRDLTDGSFIVDDYPVRAADEITRLQASAREAAAEIGEARKLLRRAEQFIANGVEFGFIRMPEPDCPDPAHDTLPLIRAFLANPPQPQKGEGWL